MKKTISGGGEKSHFFPKNKNFFKKLTFFKKKSVNQRGAPLPHPGYALEQNRNQNEQ